MTSLFRNPATLCTLVLLAAVGFQAGPAYSAKPKVDPDLPTASNPAPWAGKHISGQKCKNPRISPGGGPFDYRDKRWIGKLNLVEVAHFPEEVEQLISGKTGSIMADLDFVLRAFPNHHRALKSAADYSLRVPFWTEDLAGQPAECYLQRAMVFTPNDPVLYRIYGYYMHKRGRPRLALNANLQALPYWPDDAILHYNTALLLFDAGRFEEAETLARPLYESGLDLLGLKKKLRAKGYLRTPEELAAEQAKKEATKQKIQAMKQAAKALADPNNPNAIDALRSADPNNPVVVNPEDEKLVAYLTAQKNREQQQKQKLEKYYKAVSEQGKAKKGGKKMPASTKTSSKIALLKLAHAKKTKSGKAKTDLAEKADKQSAPNSNASKIALLKLAHQAAEKTSSETDSDVERPPESKPNSITDAPLKLAANDDSKDTPDSVEKNKPLSKTKPTQADNALLAPAESKRKNAKKEEKAEKIAKKQPPPQPTSFKSALLELAERQKYNTGIKKTAPKKQAPKKDPTAPSVSREEALEIMRKAHEKQKKEKEKEKEAMNANASQAEN